MIADSVLIRYLRLGIEDGHLLLMASQDDATAQSVCYVLLLMYCVDESGKGNCSPLLLQSQCLNI